MKSVKDILYKTRKEAFIYTRPDIVFKDLLRFRLSIIEVLLVDLLDQGGKDDTF